MTTSSSSVVSTSWVSRSEAIVSNQLDRLSDELDPTKRIPGRQSDLAHRLMSLVEISAQLLTHMEGTDTLTNRKLKGELTALMEVIAKELGE